MTRLTPEGQTALAETAARHGVSYEAAETVLRALVNGNGTQAQFNHSELGGMGQWSAGGMTMIGDMFNNALKARVDALCSDLSRLLSSQQILVAEPVGGPSGWPSDLGRISSSGAQNDMRYAVFPDTRRLAIETGGPVEIYDTADHQIGGVSQQQSGGRSLSFTSQYGVVVLSDLRRVSPATEGAAPQTATPLSQAPTGQRPNTETPDSETQVAPPASQAVHAYEVAEHATVAKPADGEAIIALIQKLADLRDSGILTDAEFDAKKTELLSRL